MFCFLSALKLSKLTWLRKKRFVRYPASVFKYSMLENPSQAHRNNSIFVDNKLFRERFGSKTNSVVEQYWTKPCHQYSFDA